MWFGEHTCLPKEVLLPDWARRDSKVTKGDRVDSISVCLVQFL